MAISVYLCGVYSAESREGVSVNILDNIGIVEVSSYLAGTEGVDGELSDINPQTFAWTRLNHSLSKSDASEYNVENRRIPNELLETLKRRLDIAYFDGMLFHNDSYSFTSGVAHLHDQNGHRSPLQIDLVHGGGSCLFHLPPS